MSKPKPVYQYDLYGNFIKEHASFEEASRHVKGKSANIRAVAKKKYKTCYGFQWRYKHEIHDRTKKIGLGKYNLDEDMKYLNKLWHSILKKQPKHNGKSANQDPWVYPSWVESFDNFYHDIVDDFESFSMETPEYKKDLINRHTWFSRIDKNKGWTPENTEFMTPDFCIRHKDDVNKIIKDGRLVTAQMVVEQLDSIGISVTPTTVINRIREKKELDKPSKLAMYKHNNKYYSLKDLSKILKFDYDYVKSRINKKKETLKEAIKSFKKYKPYSYKGHKNLAKHEYSKILSKESGLKRSTIEYRIDAGWNQKDIIKTPAWGKGKKH